MGYFKKGEEIISIEQVDGFGKNPSLWIGTVGNFVKVASFRNEKSAKDFEETFRRFLRPYLEELEKP